MAEFTEVMRQHRRMCEAHARCEACPVRWIVNPGKHACYDLAFENPAMFEERVMKWAAEHPEPVYPTWKEWQNANFPNADSTIRPCVFESEEYFNCANKIGCKQCENARIPADIAAKLGIKPIENKGVTEK